MSKVKVKIKNIVTVPNIIKGKIGEILDCIEINEEYEEYIYKIHIGGHVDMIFNLTPEQFEVL
jgi:translation initiation factor RLI1